VAAASDVLIFTFEFLLFYWRGIALTVQRSKALERLELFEPLN
jgi:hypothetical protein